MKEFFIFFFLREINLQNSYRINNQKINRGKSGLKPFNIRYIAKEKRNKLFTGFRILFIFNYNSISHIHLFKYKN